MFFKKQAHTTTEPTETAPSLPTDTGRAARIGLWALGLGLGGFVLWAAWAPLDEGVPTQGMVTVDTKRKAVQHLTGGIIKQVLVQEGDLVKEGQTLIELDETTARANYESVRQRYLGLRAMQGRLQAEQVGASNIQWHPDLRDVAADPLIRSQMQTQEQLFQSRRLALRADLQVFDENIRGQEGLLTAYQGMLSNRRQQQALLEEELKNTRALVKEGYVPRNRQLELERMVADVSAAIADVLGNTTRAQQSILELRQRAQARQQEYRKEVEQQLSDVMREVQADAEKYTAVKTDMDRLEIKSPATGQVVGLVTQTVGGVVQSGQKLMDVVPENAPLLLETKIAPHLIDKVHTGLKTDVRFSTFAHSPQLVVEGQVVSVSSDLLTEQQGGATISYYLARIMVTPEGVKMLGHRQLQPGMPVEVIVKTGERSLLTYLLNPLSKRIAASMKEE